MHKYVKSGQLARLREKCACWHRCKFEASCGRERCFTDTGAKFRLLDPSDAVREKRRTQSARAFFFQCDRVDAIVGEGGLGCF